MASDRRELAPLPAIGPEQRGADAARPDGAAAAHAVTPSEPPRAAQPRRPQTPRVVDLPIAVRVEDVQTYAGLLGAHGLPTFAHGGGPRGGTKRTARGPRRNLEAVLLGDVWMARLTKRGTTWYGYVYEGGRRVQRTTKCTDKRAAEAVVAGWERDAADPDHAARSKATLSGALKLLLDQRAEEVGRRAVL
jgi:hypothetical protein